MRNPYIRTAVAVSLSTQLWRLVSESGARGRYIVPSASDLYQRYCVVFSVIDGRATYLCDCPAGSHDKPCKHAAAVAIYRLWVKGCFIHQGLYIHTPQERRRIYADYRAKLARHAETHHQVPQPNQEGLTTPHGSTQDHP